MLKLPFLLKVKELNNVGKMAKPSIELTKVLLIQALPAPI